MWHYVSKEIDLCVSDNHNLFMGKRHKNKNIYSYNKHIFIKPQDIDDKGTTLSFINAGGVWEGDATPTINILGVEYDKKLFGYLLGIFLTDGCVNKKGIITIVQTNKTIYNKVVETLTQLKIEYTLHDKYIYISRKYLPYFKQFYLKKTRRIPQEYRMASKEFILEILKGIIDGDGDKSNDKNGLFGCRRITCQTINFANDIIDLLYKIGMSGSYVIRKPRDRYLKSDDRIIHGKQDIYTVSIKQKKYLLYNYKNVKQENYDDKMYCLTLDKWHTVLVQRNGKSIWCGQCDPPYSGTEAVYNEKRAFGGWTIENDYKMFELLEKADKKGIKWGLSNVFENRSRENQHLIDWCKKNGWQVYHLDRNYNPFSRGNSNNDEVYICNYNKEK